MIEKLYRIDISVVKNRKIISAVSEYFDNLGECIKVANEIADEVGEAYKKKYNLEKIDLDNTEYKGAFTFAEKRIYPLKDHKEYVIIELVEKVASANHLENMKSIIADINES